tara:strand:- start:58 stop:615 length:558 start_codon:yes stop_codon:yes gene_type:complete
MKQGDMDLLPRIERLKSRLKQMRQTGLEAEGEYSVENLAFKKLRNTGHLERLSQLAKTETMSQLQMENHSDDDKTDKIVGNLALHINKKKKMDKRDWNIVMKHLDAVEDQRGQWDHPNRCTMIPGNQITMQNVSYPVLGIDDTGYKQVMNPEQNYTYPGTRVFEIPITPKFKLLLSKLNNYIKMG